MDVRFFMKDDLTFTEMNSRQTGRACTVTAPGDEQFLWSLEADADEDHHMDLEYKQGGKEK